MGWVKGLTKYPSPALVLACWPLAAPSMLSFAHAGPRWCWPGPPLFVLASPWLLSPCGLPTHTHSLLVAPVRSRTRSFASAFIRAGLVRPCSCPRSRSPATCTVIHIRLYLTLLHLALASICARLSSYLPAWYRSRLLWLLSHTHSQYLPDKVSCIPCYVSGTSITG